MAGTRRNIRISSVSDRFLDGIVALDTAMSGVRASDAAPVVRNVAPGLDFQGIDQELSYYDLLVLWHVTAMSIPAGGPRQNLAHGGPIFLPWHRHFLILLEQWLQIVLDDQNFGLPYWDWAADGDLPEGQQWQTDLWTANALGEARGDVVSGTLAQMQVRLWQDPFSGTLWSINGRPLRRNAGGDTEPAFRSLPTSASVRVSLREPEYDVDDWQLDADGHRARIEGWVPSAADRRVDLHNLVHVWIGGDMGPGTSPNDPAFFLNHCNVDRIWEAWQADRGRIYSPGPGEGPMGHREDSAMFSLIGETRTPVDVLDPAVWYDYDSLTVG